MKNVTHALWMFLLVLFILVNMSCDKEIANPFPETYWVSESNWHQDGEVNTSFYTLWFGDENNFMLFVGNNPSLASHPTLSGTYQINENTLILTPGSLYSSIVPGGCTFTIQSDILINQPMVIEGVTNFDGKWEKKGTYSIKSK